MSEPVLPSPPVPTTAGHKTSKLLVAITALLVAAVAGLGVLVVQQQRDIKDLKSDVNGLNGRLDDTADQADKLDNEVSDLDFDVTRLNDPRFSPITEAQDAADLAQFAADGLRECVNSAFQAIVDGEDIFLC